MFKLTKEMKNTLRTNLNSSCYRAYDLLQQLHDNHYLDSIENDDYNENEIITAIEIFASSEYNSWTGTNDPDTYYGEQDEN